VVFKEFQFSLGQKTHSPTELTRRKWKCCLLNLRSKNIFIFRGPRRPLQSPSNCRCRFYTKAITREQTNTTNARNRNAGVAATFPPFIIVVCFRC